jgi:hypothetical protein
MPEYAVTYGKGHLGVAGLAVSRKPNRPGRQQWVEWCMVAMEEEARCEEAQCTHGCELLPPVRRESACRGRFARVKLQALQAENNTLKRSNAQLKAGREVQMFSSFDWLMANEERCWIRFAGCVLSCRRRRLVTRCLLNQGGGGRDVADLGVPKTPEASSRALSRRATSGCSAPPVKRRRAGARVLRRRTRGRRTIYTMWERSSH